MTKENKSKGIKILTKLTVSVALGTAAFLFLKSERPTSQNHKLSSNSKQKEQMFI